MSLSALAWGPGHPSIVTYDDKELLAYDSETEAPKWRLELEKTVAGVVLADATYLDLGDAASPFRTPAAVGAVVAIDEEGRLHAIDASSGRKIGDVAPLGAPRSLAASIPGQGIAVAVAGKVHVWRKGARAELAHDATALAFSNDGATLAIATEQGVLKMIDLTGLDGQDNAREVASFDTKGPVTDLTQHPSGAWLVAGSRVTMKISGPGEWTSLEKIPVGAKRADFDPTGKRVAVQLSQRQVLVYEWPALNVITRIEYTERPVRGIAFGKGNWLGVAMDHGDGNKIEVITGAVHRTDTHPGRQHRSWTLYVEASKKPATPQYTSGGGNLSASDEDAIRRMREPAPVDSGGFGRGGRIGIITVISFALLGLKLCVRLGGSGSSYSSSSYSSSGYTPPSRCDRACASERVNKLVADCAAASCSDDAKAAAAALTEGDCTKAKAAIARIPRDQPNAPLLGVDKLLAEMGVDEACADGAISAKAKKKTVHPRLIRLVGSSMTETSEDIPEVDADEGERPRAAWTASDGTLFVAGIYGREDLKAVVHKRTPDGKWQLWIRGRVTSADAPLAFFGRSASDVYVGHDRWLSHFDGKDWQDVTAPGSALEAVVGTKDDVFALVGSSGSEGDILRRTKTDWAKEKIPTDFGVTSVRAGGSSVWAVGRKDGKPAAALRGADGTWSIKTPNADAGADDEARSLWVSPTGEPFLFNESSVTHGSASGTKWVDDEMVVAGAVKAVWGRSSTDVYAASFSRVLHFDGKTWSPTSYVGKTAALSGTAKDVFVLRADE